MSLAPHMNLISELTPLSRRDFPLADASLLNPYATNPVIDGEWLQLNTSYQLARGGSGNVAVPTYPVFAERGRYDTQAIQKLPVIYIGEFEAETTCFDASDGTIGANTWLIVGDCTVDLLTRKGLKKLPTSAGTYCVRAFCTRVTGSGTTKKLRFKTVSPYLFTIAA